MLPELNEAIKKKVAELYHSGAIEPSTYREDDYTLAKILMTVTLKDQAWQYMPLSKEGKTIVKNLEHF
ncbi:MAG: hypothetical protein V1767_01150 [Chloroflexota bacterium]